MLKLPGFLLLILLDGFLLQRISVRNKKIPVLNQTFFSKFGSLDQIRSVELINCQIKEIEESTFENFNMLEELNLYDNTITNVLFSVGSLKVLEISNNFLLTPPKLSNFPNLLHLYMRDNFVSVVNYNAKKHQLASIDLSENPLKLVNISLKKLGEITIKNSKVSQIQFHINCPNLSLLGTAEVEIAADDIYNICRHNRAVILMRLGRNLEMHRCTTEDHGENLDSAKTSGILIFENPKETKESFPKKVKIGRLSSSKSEIGNAYFAEVGESDRENQRFAEEIPVVIASSSTLSENSLKKSVERILESTGFLIVFLTAIMFIVFLTSIMLWRKRRRIINRKDLQELELQAHYLLPGNIQDSSTYLTPGKIIRYK